MKLFRRLWKRGVALLRGPSGAAPGEVTPGEAAPGEVAPGKAASGKAPPAGRRKRAVVALAGVAFLAVAIFVAYQTWSVLTELRSLPLGEMLVAGPEEIRDVDPVTTLRSEGVSDAQALAKPPPPPEPTEDKPAAPGWTAPVSFHDVVEPSWRRDPLGGFWYFESAAVMRAPAGSPVVAAGPGVVATAAASPAGGWDVEVVHDNGYVTYYGNVFQLAVAPGERVSAHSLLGFVMAPTAKDPAAPEDAMPAIAFAAWNGGRTVDAAALLGPPE